MNEPTPYGTELRYFLLDGRVPMRQLTARSVSEILHPDGQWRPFYDTFRFHHEADPVGQEEFDRAVAEQADR